MNAILNAEWICRFSNWLVNCWVYDITDLADCLKIWAQGAFWPSREPGIGGQLHAIPQHRRVKPSVSLIFSCHYNIVSILIYWGYIRLLLWIYYMAFLRPPLYRRQFHYITSLYRESTQQYNYPVITHYHKIVKYFS